MTPSSCRLVPFFKAYNLLYSRRLKIETLLEFCSLRATRISLKFWVCHTHLYYHSTKFSVRNSHFLLICERFVPQKFPAIRYITAVSPSLLCMHGVHQLCCWRHMTIKHILLVVMCKDTKNTLSDIMILYIV